jgi:hypothetical protein
LTREDEILDLKVAIRQKERIGEGGCGVTETLRRRLAAIDEEGELEAAIERKVRAGESGCGVTETLRRRLENLRAAR